MHWHARGSSGRPHDDCSKAVLHKESLRVLDHKEGTIDQKLKRRTRVLAARLEFDLGRKQEDFKCLLAGTCAQLSLKMCGYADMF